MGLIIFYLAFKLVNNIIINYLYYLIHKYYYKWTIWGLNIILALTTTTMVIIAGQILDYHLMAEIIGPVTIMTLILFLALKEVLDPESSRNKVIKLLITGINIMIVPLLIIFAVIMAYKVLTVI